MVVSQACKDYLLKVAKNNEWNKSKHWDREAFNIDPFDFFKFFWEHHVDDETTVLDIIETYGFENIIDPDEYGRGIIIPFDTLMKGAAAGQTIDLGEVYCQIQDDGLYVGLID